jgi:hypothetical protein
MVSRTFRFAVVVFAAAAAMAVTAGSAAADVRPIISGGAGGFSPTQTGSDGVFHGREFPSMEEQHALPSGRKPPGNWNFPKHALPPPVVPGSGVTSTNPGLGVSVNGLRLRDQRLANGGNQFTVEPPDQALCVANGKVLESVNTVLRVKDTSGANLNTSPANPNGVMDANTFYGYPAQFNRTTGIQGPFLTDPICYFDPEHQRWVEVFLTLDVVPTTGNFTGKNHLDVAVSNTADPLGSWTIYKIPAQNDGTDGTPDHGCPTPPPADAPGATNPRAEIGDYPHIGADANAIFITTNGYCFFGSQYNGAQIYALSKQQLAMHPMSVNVVHLDNNTVGDTPGFTVWPAQSNPGQYAPDFGGTEYFLSTIAGDGSETGNPTGTANRVGVWAVSNTQSINSPSPDLRLSSRLAFSQTYVFPPVSDQKPGDFPLGQCVNDTTTPTPFGPGCWQLLFLPADEPAHDEVISHPDSGDSRMQQTWYRDGLIWGAASTGVKVGGEFKAGIAWFAVDPRIGGAGKLKKAHVEKQGYVAVADNNLSYPALAFRPDGKGVMAATLMGEGHHPSAAYIPIDSSGTVGDVHVAAEGVGVDDGFTSYKAFVGDPPRTRWGDYGAAVVDGNDVWVASEWIGQTCTLAQYMASTSCGGTRVTLGNWYTRISKVTP